MGAVRLRADRGAGGVLLIPAARRGRAGVARNGSPWRWPLYPWSLFVVMVGALCVRSWSLCVSFHYVDGEPLDLRALLPGADRDGSRPGLARDRDRRASQRHHDRRRGRPAGAGLPGGGPASERLGLPAVHGSLHPYTRRIAGLPHAARDRGLPGVCRRPARAEGPGLDGPRAGRPGRGRSADGLLRQPGGAADRADGRGGSRARRDRVAAPRLPQGPAVGRLPRDRDHPRRASISGRRPIPGRSSSTWACWP